MTDILADHWLLRFLPARTRPYAILSRWDRPIGWWLLLLPGWWGIALLSAPTTPLFWILHAKFLAGAILMRGAGCTWNDICDQKFDAYVARTASRPLPSGALSRLDAFIWLGLQLLLAAAILFTLPSAAILLGIFALLPVALYPFMKRVTWWPQAFLGLTFNWGLLLSSAAITGGITFVNLLFYLGGICWTIGYDTLYADQDIEDDALIGVRSTARLFGQNQPALIAASYAGALWFWAVGGYVAKLGAVYAGGLVLTAILLFAQLWRWRPGERSRALAAFKSNQLVGLVLWAALVLGKLL